MIGTFLIVLMAAALFVVGVVGIAMAVILIRQDIKDNKILKEHYKRRNK